MSILVATVRFCDKISKYLRRSSTYTRVLEWFKRFGKGCGDLENAPSSGLEIIGTVAIVCQEVATDCGIDLKFMLGQNAH